MSAVPSPASRPRGPDAACGGGGRVASAATIRGRRLSRLNGRDGSSNAVAVSTPPLRLLTKSGVTPVAAPLTGAILLGQGNSTAVRSAVAGGARGVAGPRPER